MSKKIEKINFKQLAASLKGNLTDHHRFMLQTVKESIKSKEQIIVKLDAQIDNQLKENELVLDTELLATIPGVGKEGAAYILAEIGNDMSQFPDEQHLASWAGMSPGNNESAGKKKALVAIGHKILVATYFILKDKVAYKELGAEYLQELKKEKQISKHLKLLKELGVEVEIKKVA